MFKPYPTIDIPVATEQAGVEEMYQRLLNDPSGAFAIESVDEHGRNNNWRLLRPVILGHGGVMANQEVDGINVMGPEFDGTLATNLHFDYGVLRTSSNRTINVHDTTQGEAEVTMLVPGPNFFTHRSDGKLEPVDKTEFGKGKIDDDIWQPNALQTRTNPKRTLVFIGVGAGAVAHAFMSTGFPRKSSVTQVIQQAA
ncbi:MAG TPA: hypothetical protein PKA02_03330 [Candidatus Saccharibacteria bacterium]|nr:hypothetical protein [Candidatus Saccharibacteria bacterium]